MTKSDHYSKTAATACAMRGSWDNLVSRVTYVQCNMIRHGVAAWLFLHVLLGADETDCYIRKLFSFGLYKGVNFMPTSRVTQGDLRYFLHVQRCDLCIYQSLGTYSTHKQGSRRLRLAFCCVGVKTEITALLVSVRSTIYKHTPRRYCWRGEASREISRKIPGKFQRKILDKARNKDLELEKTSRNIFQENFGKHPESLSRETSPSPRTGEKKSPAKSPQVCVKFACQQRIQVQQYHRIIIKIK